MFCLSTLKRVFFFFLPYITAYSLVANPLMSARYTLYIFLEHLLLSLSHGGSAASISLPVLLFTSSIQYVHHF